jgi:hypothetical protein
VTACRLCGSAGIEPCIDLGEQYLASVFVRSNEGLPLEELKAPLSAFLCRSCGLVQLGQTVRRPALFTDYHYRSSTNPMMRRALLDFAEDCAARAPLAAGDYVLDTGCNDGTMLTFLPASCRRFGIDPAANISWKHLPDGITVHQGFFGAEQAYRMSGGHRFKLVTSVAMLYSVEDILAFARDVGQILTGDGLWSIQVSYLPDMVRSLSFYDICHEHLYYFTLHTLANVLERCGFQVVDVSRNEVNGGSLRVHATHARRGVTPSGRVSDLLAQEKSEGWSEAAPYHAFMKRTESLKLAIREFLEEATARRRLVIGLGASTKGNVLLQYFGIDRSMLPYISERNPEKVGLRTLGTDIELISEERARALKPEAMLVLIWFFKDELLARERSYLDEDEGQLLFPMPYPHLVDANGTRALWPADPVLCA